MLKALGLVVGVVAMASVAFGAGVDVRKGAVPRLAPGDAAPALAVTEWVKGEGVEGFDRGHVYVVEFWATWCGPCIRYMPHLTALRREHADAATVIAVDVFERVDGEARSENVRASVERFDDRMGFRVAIDGGREMEKTWYGAAQRRGIPSTFIVDGEGRVAWIGHPMDVAVPLGSVIAGEHDIASARRAYLEAMAAETGLTPEARRRLAAGRARLQEMYDHLNAGEYEAFVAIATEVIGTILRDDATQLNALAWRVVTEEGWEGRDLDLAMRASRRACDLTEWKEPYNLDTYARVLFERGDLVGAVEWSRNSLGAAGEDADAKLLATLRGSLERYEAALALWRLVTSEP